MLRRLRKGQSTAEYAIVIGLVIAAAVGMQIYVKRGEEGRLKQTADDIGEQYAPENTTTDITTNLTSTQNMKSEVVPIPEPFTDTNGNGAYDPGEPYTDTNGNGAYDAALNDTYGLPMYGIKTTVTINNETMTRSGSESLGKFEDTLFKKR